MDDQPTPPLTPDVPHEAPKTEPVSVAADPSLQADTDSPPATPPKSEGLKSVVSTLALLLLAPLLAILLTTFFFQSYEVDGPSMQSTLQNHDRLIVLKLPRSWARLTHHAYVPHRGDIIIFNHQDVTGTADGTRQLIKRVVALPGEHVVVKDNHLTVYNKANPQGFSPDKTMSYGSVITDTAGEVDLVVPQGEIFVCGDNRPNSLDSRYFGTVPVGDVIGKLGIRIFPFNHAQVF